MTTGLCTALEGLKRHAPEVECSQFHRHLKIHQQARFNESDASIKLPLDRKEQSIDAAAAAVGYDNLPLNFGNHKTGFIGLIKTLVEIGHLCSAASSIDMSSVLPTGTAVRERDMRLLKKRIKIIRNKLNEI